MPTLNVNLFDYNKQDNSLSAELSSLEHAGFGDGYEFTIKSYKTGNEINFKYSHREFDASHEDVLAYVYVPTYPKSPISKVVIYND
jgi:hypothetical protein